MRTFHHNPKKESGKAFASRVSSEMYPKGAKHCMMHCKFATGYPDGSGAECNHKDSPYYQIRVRSWDTVGDCPCFEEGARIIEQEEVNG